MPAAEKHPRSRATDVHRPGSPAYAGGMTRVLVAGGTGLVGSAVVAECLARAADVRVLSRHALPPDSPRRHLAAQYLQADVTGNEGLNAALADVDVVIDVLDGKLGNARRTLTTGAQNLAAAAAAAGVRRLALLSIVNVDEVESSYYQAKTAQETIYRESRVPAAIVRSTQFHEFVTAFFDAGRKLRITPRIRGAKFQTIAVADVARVLADTALSEAEPPGIRNIGGPEVLGMDAMARIYRQFRDRWCRFRCQGRSASSSAAGATSPARTPWARSPTRSGWKPGRPRACRQ
jgi:uncharacterized protein YbjT (DUF2867 family)